MMWGKHMENGLWVAKSPAYKIMLFSADRVIYLAINKFRLRLMKPWRASIN